MRFIEETGPKQKETLYFSGVTKMGGYPVSIAVLPSLLIGVPAQPAKSAEHRTSWLSTRALSDAGAKLDLYLLRGARGLLAYNDPQPHELTLSRTPKLVKRFSARVVRRDRDQHFAETPAELESWLGGQGD